MPIKTGQFYMAADVYIALLQVAVCSMCKRWHVPLSRMVCLASLKRMNRIRKRKGPLGKVRAAFIYCGGDMISALVALPASNL